ncbi:MAG: amino acid ABC transporter substrate-binding protein [Proteobacteria bacterium]|nr:amino acid ABC transporter substrate-binding protein [Pseudomonadota bacterium]
MRLIAIVLAACVLLPLAQPASAQATLDAVRKRGSLSCGVNGAAPGFSMQNAAKQWEGLDVDLCRAIAAATLGDATKVTYTPLTAERRFAALETGSIDVLARNTTVSLQRSAGVHARFAAINYYDGQAFVVPKQLKLTRVSGLADKTVCVTKGTTHEFNMAAWFTLRGFTIYTLNFDTQEQMYAAFFAGRCQAVTQDSTALAAAIVQSGKVDDYMMLPDIISKEPLGPYVRNGDSPWLDVVRWTHYAMLEAEEREITRNNVDGKLEAKDVNVQLLLGVRPGNGKILGLDEKWAYNIVKQVGNYGEIFERNVGGGSALKFGRGVNALWTRGGAMYAPPLR